MKNLAFSPDDYMQLPRRPGYGTVGQACLVRANHYPLHLPKETLLLYDAAIEPDVKNRKKRRRMFDMLEKHTAFQQFVSTAATDYSKLIVSTVPLNPAAAPNQGGRAADRVEITIIYKENDDGDEPKDTDKAKHRFTITRTTEIHRSDIDDYLQGRKPDYNYGQAIQALNIILAKFPNKSSNMVPVGRNKFFVINEAALKFDLGPGLTALKGYYTSVRPTVGNMMVNLNVCTTAFYKFVLLVRLICIQRRLTFY